MPTTISKPLKTIQDAVVTDLKRYRRLDRNEQTPVVRALATIMVDVREHFLSADGEPDWRGQTQGYKQWVRECYDRAGFDEELRTRLQQTIRYHTTDIIRQRLDQDQQEDLGLRRQSQREARNTRRQSDSAMLAALTAQDSGGPLRALLGAKGLLAAVGAAEVRDLAGAERDVAVEAAEAVRRKAGNLLRALGR